MMRAFSTAIGGRILRLAAQRMLDEAADNFFDARSIEFALRPQFVVGPFSRREGHDPIALECHC